MESVETRRAVAKILVESCPIRDAIRGTGRKCRYFGPSESCDTCEYPWEAIAHRIISVDRVLSKREREDRAKRKREKAAGSVQEKQDGKPGVGPV